MDKLIIKLELNIDQVNLVMGALSKLPFEHVVNIITELQKQITPQVPQQPAPSNSNMPDVKIRQ